MNLIRLIYHSYRRPFLFMLGFTSLSGALGIATLAYLNRFLLQAPETINPSTLWQLLVIVAAYFALASFSQYQLAKLGQHFIYDMQTRLVKRILDSEEIHIAQAGKARLLASLSSDIRTLSFAFTRLPEMLQGIIFSLACSLYLISLSLKIFLITALLLIFMIGGSHLLALRHYQQFRHMRRLDDNIYRHYETALNGHRELALNRYRAQHFFEQDFVPATEEKHHYHLRGDAYSALSANWSNSLMLAAVGIIFYLSLYHHWASLNQATTISMTVLFMRAPLIAMVGALPAIMQSEVAMQALQKLELAPYERDFHRYQALPQNWQSIRLENICYQHPSQSTHNAEIPFALKNINLEIKRGETLFLIGANGSGKSTLSLILTGLYAPDSGKIFVDDIEIKTENRSAYRQLFSSVFTDFHLFEHLLDGQGKTLPNHLIEQWLHTLQLENKVLIENQNILNSKLSQGQKKRLALMIAALEQRSILLLDEWAADQDPQFRRQFYQQLLPQLKTQDYTLFAISHDDKYFQHADRILMMEKGELQEISTETANVVLK